MEKRKNPEKDVKRLSGLFFQIGLLTALILAVCAFEFRTVKFIKPIVIGASNSLEPEIIPITAQKPPPPPPRKPKLLNPVETVEPVPEDFKPEILELPDPIEDLIVDINVIHEVEEKAPEYHDYVEQMPAPIGGYDAFYKFISKNMRYPAKARRGGIEGTVFVQFVVDQDGKITNVKAIKGAGEWLNKEAERVLSLSPEWIPGRQGGRKVKVRIIIPILFKLNK